MSNFDAPKHVNEARRAIHAAVPRKQWPTVTVQALSGSVGLPIVRVRIGGNRGDPSSEVTFHETETPAMAAWIASVVGGAPFTSPLPCTEHREPRWNADYRWTAQAHAVYGAARAAGGAR